MERLTRERAGADPYALFMDWLLQAQQQELPLPNAMNLATVDGQGRPRARMVLFKGLIQGEFTFYTNYHSTKAQELEANPHAALTFYWEPPGRQVRIEGVVHRLDTEANEQYFHTRPRGSQLGAYASRQSSVVEDRAQLLRQFQEAEQQFEGAEIPCPEDWGGYALTPHCIEFWQNAPDRMHDRIRFQRTEEGWSQDRLSP